MERRGGAPDKYPDRETRGKRGKRKDMRKIVLALVSLVLFSFTVTTAYAEPPARLVILELRVDGTVTVNAIPPSDDSMTNPDYKLLAFHWDTTANYWVNPANKYGLAASAVVTAIAASGETWDKETAAEVFAYQGTTTKTAGRRDLYNVVSWGSYRVGAIAVTYIWYSGSQILETDTKLNSYYQWSLTGEARKMDVQNIMTHEFGHWAGLADLYSDGDYWLTMYGYAGYGETYKRTLGQGDIYGLEAVYGL